MKTQIEKLEELFNRTINYQLELMESGEASSKDIANTIKLLKDNSIVVNVADDSATAKLKDRIAMSRGSVPKQLAYNKSNTITIIKEDLIKTGVSK